MGLQEQLAQIDALIEAILTEAATKSTAIVDYVEGDVEVKNSQRLAGLYKARKALLANRSGTVKRIAFDFAIDEFGVERGQFES